MNNAKEHILKTAFGLFLRKNYKEVTMKEIVKKTGMSKGAFYHYFSSKEEMFGEVLNHYIHNLFLNTDYSAFRNTSLCEYYHDYLDHIWGVFETMVLHFSHANDSQDVNRLGINFFSFMFDAVKLFPAFKEKIIQGQERELQSWKTIINKARSTGEIKSEMSDEQISKIFSYIGDGQSIRSIIIGTTDNFKTEICKLWDALYSDLKAK